MDTLEAIKQRRAVKHYDCAHKMDAVDERRLLELAMQAPTAFNIQHWRFLLIKDAALRRQIREMAWDQAQVTDASLLIVVCADLKAWQKEPERYWRDAPEEVRAILLPAIAGYYKDNPRVERDECMRSCGIAGQTIMLAAKAMGLDSCPMDGFDFEAVAKLVRLPADHVIAFMIAVGKGTRPPWPKPGQLSYDEVVLTDRF